LRGVLLLPGSRLTRIGDACFKGTALDSVWLPLAVLGVGKGFFAGDYEQQNRIGQVHFGRTVQLTELDECCFCSCRFESIVVPGVVLGLGRACFAGPSWGLNRIKSLTFEQGPQLKRIEERCFAYCAQGAEDSEIA
jgi:hypothetical protein